MKNKYAIIAGASALVLCAGLLTGCSQKQAEEPVEEDQILEEELNETTPEIEEEIIVDEPAEGEAEEPVEEIPVEDPEADANAGKTILVAQLTEIAEDGAMTIQPYAPADETSDAAAEDVVNVDFEAYLALEESQTLLLSEEAHIDLVQDGQLVEADASALTVGSMLIVITDADGNQAIVVHPAAEETAE